MKKKQNVRFVLNTLKMAKNFITSGTLGKLKNQYVKVVGMMKLFNENIEYSKDWLVQEIIKTDFEQRKTNQIQYVKMTKIDLLRLVQKFIKLNEKGE
jgi:hypothetical protein